MSDNLTPSQRQRCMSHIRSKDTKPEIIIRRFLFAKGLRFRLHAKQLPGKPDLTFPKYKTIVFIDGCFWHSHENCKYSKLPKTNVDYWIKKLENNKLRDEANEKKLEEMGWRVIRIWECEIKNASSRLPRLESLFHQIINPNF